MADWPGIYNTGTATVAANATAVTIQNGGSIAQAVRPGDRFGSHIGRPIRIAAVSAGSLTLAYPWPGPAQTAAPYEITFSPYDGGYRQALQTLLDRYGGGGVAALAELDLVADRMVYADGPGSLALAPLTAFARTLLDDADASTAQTSLGISAFIKTLLDDADQAAALTTLGAQAAGDYQVSNPKLTSLAGLTGAPDRLPYLSGANAFTLATLTAFARTILDDADASAALTTLGVSAFAKTILDDASGAEMFATMGATQLFASSGYTKLPNGLMIQWSVSASANSDYVVTLPLAFTSAHYATIVCVNGNYPVNYAAYSDQLGLSNYAVRKRYNNASTSDAVEVRAFSVGV